MNFEDKRNKAINELEQKLRNGEPVKRFVVFPYRQDLRRLLLDDKNALEELESLVESVYETL